MSNRTHHVFFSYARKDNGEDNNHFISRFHDLLRKEHEAVTGRELKTFFDTEAIDSGERWKTRLGQGLRDSRLFVAFLSDNYLKSEVCRWEWEHYLLTEHTAARGEDGVVPLYFIPIDELGKESEEQLAEWIEEIKQRNLGAYCQLQPWYKAGRERARELDAAERADALRQVDVGSKEDLPLQERIRRLNLRICRRLDRIQLAEQVIGNVVRPYRHFVGRHKQLRELHEALTTDQTQLLATVHSPGGLGKSALARQYAIAYADFYAAGGVWELKCANLTHLGDALRQLEQHNALTEHGFNLEEDREKTADQQAASVLAQLKRITHARRDTVNQQLRNVKNRHTPEDHLEVRENSRCLLILDNVDDTAMLAADQLNLIPAEDWLSVIVTTRLSPDSFGAATSLKSIEVPPLNLAEGTELLRTFVPGEAFPDREEAKAAEELVKALDGYTIALELIGAFVHTNWTAGARLSKYLGTLKTRGLAATDQLAGKKGIEDKIAYQHRQIALIVDDSLTSLREQLDEEYGEEMATAAQHIVEIASLLQPDIIPAPWLEAMLKQAHPDLEETDEGLEPSGIILQALTQLSLLNPAERRDGEDENAAHVLRMHRVTAAHIANRLSEGGRWHWQQVEACLHRIAEWMRNDSNLETLDQRNSHQQWLIAQAAELIEKRPSAEILRSLSQAVSLEGHHGSLNLAIELAYPIKEHREAILARNPDSADAAHQLSTSQNQLGGFYLRRGQRRDAERTLGYYKASLEIAKELHRRDPESASAARDLLVSRSSLGDFYLQRGQRGDAERALGYYKASLEIAEELHRRDPESAEAARDLLVSQSSLGYFYLRPGQLRDAERALKFFESVFRTCEELRRRNPESARAARDLSVSQSSLGDALRKANRPGAAEQALNYYKASMKIREDLHRRNPDSAQTARDLSISQVRLGDALRKGSRLGDAEQPLDYYEASLKINEELHRRNPDSAEAARALAVSQVTLGGALMGQALRKSVQAADVKRAMNCYELALKSHENLFRRNPDSAWAVRDLAISQERLGNFLRRRGQPGDADEAQSYYEAAIETRRTAYRRNPHSIQATRALVGSQRNLGNFLRERCQPGDAEEAQSYYEASLGIATDFYRQHPHSAEAARELSWAQQEFGSFLELRGLAGDVERALDWYATSLETVDEFHRRYPDSAEAARNLSFLQQMLGNIHRIPVRIGNIEQALGYYQASVETLVLFYRRNPDCTKIARDLAAAQSGLGNFYRHRGQPGDIERELECFTASLKIYEDLYRRDHSSIETAQDLIESQDSLGRFHERRDKPGSADLALTYFEASLEIAEELHNRFPEITDFAHRLSGYQKKLADFYCKRGQSGDFERALCYYRGSLRICTDLYRRDPDRIMFTRDLSEAQCRLGNFYSQRGQSGDVEQAIDCYEAAVKIREDAQSRTPENEWLTRDSIRALDKLENLYWQRGQSGDVDQRIACYEASVKSLEALWCRNPADAQLTSKLSISKVRLGDVYSERGHQGDVEQVLEWYQASLETLNEFSGNPNKSLPGNLAISQEKLGDFFCKVSSPPNDKMALHHYQTAFEFREDLRRRYPDSDQVTRDLSVVQTKLGDFYLRRGQPGDAERALGYYEASLKIAEDLHRRNSDSAQAARDLAVLKTKIGDLYRQRGQSGDAEMTVDYYKAVAKALESLMNRSDAGAKILQTLQATERDTRLPATGTETDELILRAQERIHRLLRAMKENGILLDFDCDQMLAELDEVLSNNQSQ